MAGFTLVEVMIVIALIATIMSLGLPAIERVTYQRLNSTTRRFVGMMRTIRNDSILLNNIHRLAIDFEKQTYWVEQQREQKPLEFDPEEFKKKRSSKEEPPPSNFIPATKFGKDHTPMPDGIVMEGVLKENEGMVVRKEGIVYIHFFPNGFAERSVLYMSKEGSDVTGYSLVIRPAGGRVDIIGGKVENFAAYQ